ncbi:phosphoesterase RecJ domain protein [Methanocaldococcus vulcanius M7]|uniref:Phosphoesterase RecJ domain protein n=2 Tax=Methanocaldococcus TaxID=196118 RepID=C9REJ6_METVM|nr:phosphoesterase RecJ domain protein [Methanocaldococcus vulcanius M7]
MVMEKLKEMEEVVKAIKEKILNHNGYIRVITHHDTDGLSSGGILVKMLLRTNKLFHLTVVEHLSKEVIEKLAKENEVNKPLFIFADMGSGQIEEIMKNNFNAIILDHHPPKIKESFLGDIIQLNPHIFGIDGAKEITASGVCYLVAREFGYYDLSVLAIVGIIGDMQYSPLLGLNKFIVNEAREYRFVKIVNDIVYNIYDVEMYKAIAYCTKPYIPDLASESKAFKFLKEIGIDPNKKYLDESERKKLLSSILFRYPKIDNLTVNRFIIEHKVKDAFLMSEMLNAVGRNGLFAVGIGICLEDEECINIGKNILWKYKKNLINELKSVKLESLKNILYFEGKKGMIGIIASILADEKPVIGYHIEGDIAKFSARGNRDLVNRGLNLSVAMAVAEEFGGTGGGHNVASGAVVPKDKIMDFLKRVDEIIGEQLNSKKNQ